MSSMEESDVAEISVDLTASASNLEKIQPVKQTALTSPPCSPYTTHTHVSSVCFV